MGTSVHRKPDLHAQLSLFPWSDQSTETTDESEASSTHSLSRRFEAEFLRPYRGADLAGVVGALGPVGAVVADPAAARLGGRSIGRVLPELSRPGRTGPSASLGIARSIGLASGRHDSAVRGAVAAGLAIADMMGRISQEVVVALRGALHRKLMRLPMAYFDAQQTGRLMARVTSDVGSILMFIRSGILQLLNDLILSVAIAFLLGWLQWRLAVVALVAVPLYAINQRAFFGTLHRLSEEIRSQVSSLYALLSERVSAVRVVRSFAKEDDELRELDERIDRHRALSWDNTRAAAALGALATLISGLGTVFVIAYGVVLVGRGLLTVGELLAIYALVGQLYQPIVRLTQFQATALATQVSVSRLYEIFDEPEPVRDRPAPSAIVRAARGPRPIAVCRSRIRRTAPTCSTT